MGPVVIALLLAASEPEVAGRYGFAGLIGGEAGLAAGVHGGLVGAFRLSTGMRWGLLERQADSNMLMPSVAGLVGLAVVPEGHSFAGGPSLEGHFELGNLTPGGFVQPSFHAFVGGGATLLFGHLV